MRWTVGALILPALLVATSVHADGSTLDLAKAAYDDRADIDRAMEAVDLFRAAAEESPDSYEARWMGTRAVFYIALFPWDDAPKAQRLELFEGWIGLAEEAVALNPEGGDGHFWLGALLGLYGNDKGLFKALGMLPRIKEELNASLSLDPTLEGYGPDRAVGRMLQRLPWFKGGDNDTAVVHLERAVNRAPQHPLNHLFLADSYKKIGRREDARKVLRAFLAMPPSAEFAPEHAWVEGWARDRLRKLE